MTTFCGYIVFLGRPNAGKSTLLNACIGQKIAGVSKKPQTTRHRILGITTESDTQFIFLDTPGIHNSAKKHRINKFMNKSAWSAVQEANVICYLIDTKAGWHTEDALYLSNIIDEAKSPIVVCATKIDAIKKNQADLSISHIQQQVESLVKSKGGSFELVQPKVFSVSAKRPESLQQFKNLCKSFLPASAMLFPEDDLTDQPEKFVVAEMIREQLFRSLSQEIPYGTSVVIEELSERASGHVHIKATIIVNQANHKAIVIGKQGQTIKTIGQNARQTLEQHFLAPVYLDLFVRVVENWLDNPGLIQEFEGLT